MKCQIQSLHDWSFFFFFVGPFRQPSGSCSNFSPWAWTQLWNEPWHAWKGLWLQGHGGSWGLHNDSLHRVSPNVYVHFSRYIRWWTTFSVLQYIHSCRSLVASLPWQTFGWQIMFSIMKSNHWLQLDGLNFCILFGNLVKQILSNVDKKESISEYV